MEGLRGSFGDPGGQGGPGRRQVGPGGIEGVPGSVWRGLGVALEKVILSFWEGP